MHLFQYIFAFRLWAPIKTTFIITDEIKRKRFYLIYWPTREHQKKQILEVPLLWIFMKPSAITSSVI